MDITSFGISDIGLSRTNNEDVWAELPEYNFFVLADGMGGHKAGEVAAKEAVLQLCDTIDTLFADEKELSLKEACTGVKRGIAEANYWVYTLSQNHPELSGMGTTLCSLLILNRTAIYANVGDSRIYRFRKKLEQLSHDHSMRQLPTFKNVLTRAVGTTKSVEIDLDTTHVQEGDMFLLCSDGLTDYVSDSEIETILRNTPNIKEASLELVEAAKVGGGNDNITLILIHAQNLS